MRRGTWVMVDGKKVEAGPDGKPRIQYEPQPASLPEPASSPEVEEDS